MFPGLKQNGGGSSHPGTPINTPATSRSNGASNSLFQPIPRSTSTSGLSGSSLLPHSSTSQLLHVPESAHAPGLVLHEAQHKDAACQTDETKPDSSERHSGAAAPVARRVESEGEVDQTRKNSEGTHHRTRSNEIDYSSIGVSKRGPTAFRSPPGTMRGFRPVSVDSAHSSLSSQLSSSSSRPTSAISTSSEVTVTPPSSRPLSSGSGGSHSPLHWSKEFDSLFSDYFNSNDKVTDC